MICNPPLPFCDAFDEQLAHLPTGAVFTVDHEGTLRFDGNRTRDLWRTHGAPSEHAWCHCLARDTATGWVQYLLITSPDLCGPHPRFDLQLHETQEAALRTLEALGTPPVRTETWPPRP